MKKKGFTLIELLAVIVILAIIALIAVPVVLNMIENARRSSAKSSAYGYIDAINNNNELSSMKDEDMGNIPNTIPDGKKDVSEIDIKIKGKKPTSGEVTITNGRVVSANLCINNYMVIYANNEAEVGEKCSSSSSETHGQLVEETAEETIFAYTDDGEITGFKEGLTNQPTEIVIPDKIGGVTIKSIRYGVFEDKGLTSVKISNSITTIEAGAFNRNQITSLDLGNSVTSIENGAFSQNQISSLTIPKSVVSISQFSFTNNPLTSITIDIKDIPNESFSQFQLANINIGDNVETIGYGAFADNPIQSINIGKNVQSIGRHAFYPKPQKSYSIINKSGRSFNWCDIIGDSSTESSKCTAETGNYYTIDGNYIITISK